MKWNSNLRNYLSALTLSTLLTACSSDSIVLEGTVKNLAGRPLVYTRTIGGIHLAKLDTVAVRPDSTFRITLPADGVERINFYPPERGIRSLFLRPGQVQLDIDATATHPLGVPDTPERRLAEALSELDHNVWDLRTRQGDAWNVTKDTIASSVRTTLQEAADAYESALATVDEEVRALAAADIRMQLLLAFEQQHMATTFRNASDTLKQAWNAELERMADLADLSMAECAASPAFADAVSNLTGIRLYYERPLVDRSTGLFPRKGVENPLCLPLRCPSLLKLFHIAFPSVNSFLQGRFVLRHHCQPCRQHNGNNRNKTFHNTKFL